MEKIRKYGEHSVIHVEDRRVGEIIFVRRRQLLGIWVFSSFTEMNEGELKKGSDINHVWSAILEFKGLVRKKCGKQVERKAFGI